MSLPSLHAGESTAAASPHHARCTTAASSLSLGPLRLAAARGASVRVPARAPCLPIAPLTCPASPGSTRTSLAQRRRAHRYAPRIHLAPLGTSGEVVRALGGDCQIGQGGARGRRDGARPRAAYHVRIRRLDVPAALVVPPHSTLFAPSTLGAAASSLSSVRRRQAHSLSLRGRRPSTTRRNAQDLAPRPHGLVRPTRSLRPSRVWTRSSDLPCLLSVGWTVLALPTNSSLYRNLYPPTQNHFALSTFMSRQASVYLPGPPYSLIMCLCCCCNLYIT